MCDTLCSGRAGKSLLDYCLNWSGSSRVSEAAWQGATAFMCLSEAFPRVEGGVEHQGRGKQMLRTFEFKAVDVNKLRKRKKGVSGDF